MAESVIKSSSSITYGTITKIISGGTFQQYNCYKVGNVVHVAARVYNLPDTTVSTNDYFQLPVGFRPRVETHSYGTLNIVSKGVFVSVTSDIETDGKVSFSYSGTEYATAAIFSATFAI